MFKPYRGIPFEVTYFRESGIYQVPPPESKPLSGHDNVECRDSYIFSFQKWSDTLAALKDKMPSDGSVITTDYATIEDWSELPHDPGVIKDRIRQIIKLSRATDAILYLGTPVPENDQKSGESYWRNSALTIHRGTLVSAAHKTSLFPSEKRYFNMREPQIDRRIAYIGGAALICSETLDYLNSDSPLPEEQPHEIMALTNLAIPPHPSPTQEAAVREAGGEDDYYRQWLEMGISRYVLQELPSVQRVIVSDRGRPDLPPYNAVFYRNPQHTTQTTLIQP